MKLLNLYREINHRLVSHKLRTAVAVCIWIAMAFITLALNATVQRPRGDYLVVYSLIVATVFAITIAWIFKKEDT